MAASKATLSKIHEKVAEIMLKTLEEGEQIVTKEGEVITVRPRASMLSAIRQFLSDNKIEATPGHESPAMKRLADKLPQFTDDDEDYVASQLRG